MPDYLTVVYAYLPMTLAANLAYYLPAMITQSGKILPVFAQNLGYTDIFLPSLSWDVHVATFLQGVTLLGIVPVSIFALFRISKGDLLRNLPHICLLMGFVAVFFGLMVF